MKDSDTRTFKILAMLKYIFTNILFTVMKSMNRFFINIFIRIYKCILKCILE